MSFDVLLRKARHSGSWYEGQAYHLSNQLEDFLNNAELFTNSSRAIITPHAGYSYSGPCAGFAYKQINPNEISRVFVLGPSHHCGFSGCALSPAEVIETPMGNLEVDLEIVENLKYTKIFKELNLKQDMEEHSLEMQFPFIFKVFEGKNIKIVPIMVGNCNSKSLTEIGEILSPFLADMQNLFVISSDFCHWGHRFAFTPYDRSKGDIWQSIEAMDRKGMDLIENLNPDLFSEYLDTTGNTICGRNPILVLLHTIRKCETASQGKLQFVKYDQSSKITFPSDSSVSYAAAYFNF